MSDPDDKTYYEVVFGSRHKSDEIRGNALNRAWQIRNFEIELYWRRALYFWGFIFLAATGYFSAPTEEYHLFIACAGFVFSVAWFLVNKASKFWQENWECHIDCLEDEFEGKLYKTVMENKTGPLNPLKGYTFSVSKINQIVSLLIIFGWLGLILNELFGFNLSFIKTNVCAGIVFLVIFILLVIYMAYVCKTDFVKKKPPKLKKSSTFMTLANCKYRFFYRDIKKD